MSIVIQPKYQVTIYCIVSLAVVFSLAYSYFYLTVLEPQIEELKELRLEEARLDKAIMDEREKQSKLLDEMIAIMQEKVQK